DRVRGGVAFAVHPSFQRARLELRDDTAELFMLFRQQLHVVSPRPWSRRTFEPVRPAKRKTAADAACQPSPHDVLPIRGLDDELTDVVPVRSRTPRRAAALETTDRGPQCRPVPRMSAERFVDEPEQLTQLGVRSTHTSHHGITLAAGSTRRLVESCDILHRMTDWVCAFVNAGQPGQAEIALASPDSRRISCLQNSGELSGFRRNVLVRRSFI